MRAALIRIGEGGGMRTTTRRTMTATITLALALTLGACGDDQPADSPGVDSTGVETPSAPAGDDATDDAGTDDAATGGADDSTGDGSTADTSTADAADDTASEDTASGATSGDAGGTDVTASGVAAILAAQEEVDGVAFEIDDQDEDGTWEVDVRVGDRSVEVTVDAQGTVVRTDDEDDLDAEDREALDSAAVPLEEAISIALEEVGGQLDDAELDEEDGTYVWKVSVDGTDDGRDDVEVSVDIVSGEVVKVD